MCTGVAVPAGEHRQKAKIKVCHATWQVGPLLLPDSSDNNFKEQFMNRITKMATEGRSCLENMSQAQVLHT
jgi:hypothetical protein